MQPPRQAAHHDPLLDHVIGVEADGSLESLSREEAHALALVLEGPGKEM